MEIDASSDVNIDDVNVEIPIDEQENITKIHRDEWDCSTVESLKKELQLRETQIMKLTSHIHMLETDPPSQSKKRRLGEIDKEDMNETMMKDKDRGSGATWRVGQREQFAKIVTYAENTENPLHLQTLFSFYMKDTLNINHLRLVRKILLELVIMLWG